MYATIQAELEAGGRAYIICPLVEASKAATLEDVKAAEDEHARLVAGALPSMYWLSLFIGGLSQSPTAHSPGHRCTAFHEQRLPAAQGRKPCSSNRRCPVCHNIFQP